MQVLVRLSPRLYRELEEESRSLGVSKAEVLRRALREYLERRKGSATRRVRGLVKPRLSMEELEEIYMVEGREGLH